MKLILLIISFIPLSLLAQCWNAGTGADGVFHATVDTTLAGNIYNFSSFTIDSGVTVNVTGNSALQIYCQNTVAIYGTLNANGGNGTDGITSDTYGTGGIGVAGGMNGGDGVYSSTTGPLNGYDGFNTGGVNTKGTSWSGGGGGGYASTGASSGSSSGGGAGGASYGDSDLTGFPGGSGGGGGSGGYSCGSGGGGAGGGIIIFYTNSLIIGVYGAIHADGGNGGSDGTGNCGGGGGGSGGTIFLSALSIDNNGAVTAHGGTGGASAVPGNPYYGGGGDGSEGRIRIDHAGTITGSGTVVPAAGATHTIFGPTNQTITLCPGESLQVGSNTYTSAGNFQDTLIAASGCDSIVNTSLSYYPVAGSSQSFQICAGESIQVGSSIYTASGTYQDIFTSVNGCDSMVTTTLTVAAAVDVTVQDNTTHLHANSATGTFQWLDCDNSNAPIAGQTMSDFTPTVNGNYAVIVTENMCTDTSACMFFSHVGIEESSLLTEKIYPNPTNGKFIITLSSDQMAKVTVTDFTGRIIRAVPNYISGTELNLSQEAKGVYLVNIQVGKQVQIVRVTKQ